MKKILYLLFSLLLLVSCGSNNEPIVNEDPIEPPIVIEPEPEVFYSKLDGRVIDNEEENDRRIYAVMFDDDKNARPQSGLSHAAIVYEIRVEGAATRYMGIFQTDENLTLGPIRSARPYFVETVAEYGNVVYGHHGGSQDGIKTIHALGIHNIDGMSYDGSVYRRQSHKLAPHNSYATIERFSQKADELGYPETNNFEGFNFFEEPTSLGGTPANGVELYYSNNTTSYSYNSETKTYERYKDGILHVDEQDSLPLEVSNIIIQHVDSWLAANGLHKILDNIGSGTGYLISHGEAIPITWSKENQTARTIYQTESGEPIQLNPGQTWIQWIDTTSTININE